MVLHQKRSIDLMEQPILFTAALLSALLIFFSAQHFCSFLLLIWSKNSEHNQAGVMLKNSLLVPFTLLGIRMGNICNCTLQKDLMQSIDLCPSELSFHKTEMKCSKGPAKPSSGCSGMSLRGGFGLGDQGAESNKQLHETHWIFSLAVSFQDCSPLPRTH